MKDPFVILRAELVEAAERAALPAPRKRWGWVRRPSRPVAMLLVALVIAGSAAAAVLSLSASQPLVGRLPGAITPASVAGYGYTIAVTPADNGLGAGVSGWDSWIVYGRPGTRGYVGEGAGICPGYPRATNPIFGGGSVEQGVKQERRVVGEVVEARRDRAGGLHSRGSSPPAYPCWLRHTSPHPSPTSPAVDTLIGADLLNVPRVSSLGAGVAAIGGAGTFDGIFLSSIMAVVLVAVA